MRALRLDSFRASRIGLILAVVNMAVLIGWFFFAKVTLYEVSTTLESGADGRVLATFSGEALERLQQGQSATLRLSGSADRPGLSLPAYLFSLERGKNPVEFVIMANDTLPSGKLSGRLEVEVERVTPAELVLRTSGRYLNQGQIPVSPQQPQPGN